MDYKIVVSPELGITPKELAELWNQENAELGEASVETSPFESFDAATTALIVSTVVGIASGVLTSALYDLLKAKLNPNKPQSYIIKTVAQPDGSEIQVLMPIEIEAEE